MGLDLLPMGRAVSGQEAEWKQLMEPLYTNSPTPADHPQRLLAISIPPHADIGAPRVGSDEAANAWMIARARQAGETKSDAEIIKVTEGYYVVELLLGKCDGVPAYSNAGLYEIEATSLRGEFLTQCTAFLDPATIALAWRTATRPSDAVAYGRQLLAALNSRVTDEPGASSGQQHLSVQEQRQVIEAAGRWYIFWGERGNPVWAYF